MADAIKEAQENFCKMLLLGPCCEAHLPCPLHLCGHLAAWAAVPPCPVTLTEREGAAECRCPHSPTLLERPGLSIPLGLP